MKSLFIIVAVIACVCAAYAVPVSEPRREHDPLVLSHIDEIAELDAKFDPSKLVDADGQLQHGWMNHLPWGSIVDVIIDAIKKAAQ